MLHLHRSPDQLLVWYPTVRRPLAACPATCANILACVQVRPPGSSGVSHERKIRSYEAEGVFYTSVAPQLLQHTDCAVPQPVHLEIQPPGSFTFVLSDLSHDFPEQHHSYSLQEAQVGGRHAGRQARCSC